MKALSKARQPLRYNELHKEADRVFGHRIWIKTFNDHLKKLCANSIVLRKEKNRYHVTYELKDIDKYTEARQAQLLKDLEGIMTLPGGEEFFQGVVDDVKEKLRRQGVLVK